MAKVKKIGTSRIRKITGGKEPLRMVEEFMIRRGFDPAECLQQRTSDIASWAVPVGEDEELEVSLEGMNRPPETTLYMGVNIMSVPIRECHQVVTASLTVADTLIGAKLSLVNYDIVLSITNYTANMSVNEIDYMYELIYMQKPGVLEAIHEELRSDR
ncbi:MAG: hypothetical protein KDD44_13350 [Bdellovibrionales bacterium]|nr:hypothetical protein [Bdellovibrionales bacterium]